MSALKKISRTGLWLALAAIGGHNFACSSKFTSCYAARSCAPSAAGSAGADEAAGSQETAGSNDSPDAASDGGDAGLSNGGTADEVEAGTGGQGGEAGVGKSEETGGDAQTGGTEAGGSGPGGGPTLTGGSGAIGGSSCNNISQRGVVIPPQLYPSTPLPAGTRATISPGNYVLSKSEWFLFTASAFEVGATISISVNGSIATIQGAANFNGDLLGYTSTLLTNEPLMTFYTCIDPPSSFFPKNAPQPADYSATSTSFALLVGTVGDSGYRLTYDKQ